jgi:hypothetical protein
LAMARMERWCWARRAGRWGAAMAPLRSRGCNMDAKQRRDAKQRPSSLV